MIESFAAIVVVSRKKESSMKYRIGLLLSVLSFSVCIADTAPEKQKGASCMWISCSAGKLPAGKVLGFEPGELYVHTTLANMFNCDDPSCQLSLRHALHNEKVSVIVVCGSYGCPGIQSALQSPNTSGDGLDPIRALYQKNKSTIDQLPDEQAKVNRLAELNVVEQVEMIRSNPLVKAAKQPLTVRGIAQDPESQKSTELICVKVVNE
jgi:carbonic anhydrase